MPASLSPSKPASKSRRHALAVQPMTPLAYTKSCSYSLSQAPGPCGTAEPPAPSTRPRAQTAAAAAVLGVCPSWALLRTPSGAGSAARGCASSAMTWQGSLPWPQPC